MGGSETGGSETGGSETRTEAKRAFTAYLEALDQKPELSFEDWVQAHCEIETELRALHQGWVRVCATLSQDPPGDDGLGAGLQVLEEIGRGGCGRVYRARDKALQRDIALKIIDRDSSSNPNLRKTFIAEARALAKLDHPNIVGIHAIDEIEGQVRLALELIKGHTLQEIVERDGPLSANEASQVGIELCSALAALHRENLVHMDIKPGNIMRKSGGRIVLLDFGFARDDVPDTTEDGGPRGGTPPFMSPEHLSGSTPDARTDIYSLGATLYWCVSGRYPHSFKDRLELYQRILQGITVPLRDVRPDVPVPFVGVIEKAMRTDPAERYASVGEMERALRVVLEEAHVAPARSRTTPVLLGAALIMLLVALLLRSSLFGSTFEVEARFQKHIEGESAPALLTASSLVSVQDRLFLEVESDEPFHLYVFNEDDRGRWYRLWPTAEASRALAPGMLHRLPGPDPENDFWIVDTAAGREHVFLVASREPDLFAEALTALIPPAEEEVAFTPTTVQCRELDEKLLRGIGKAQTAPDGRSRQRSLLDYFAEFERHLEAREGVCYRRLEWVHHGAEHQKH